MRVRVRVTQIQAHDIRYVSSESKIIAYEQGRKQIAQQPGEQADIV